MDNTMDIYEADTEQAEPVSLALGATKAPETDIVTPKFVKERPQPVVIYDEKGQPEYELDFNRESIDYAEKRGFDINEVLKYPATGLKTLFWLAFRMKQRGINKVTTDAIYDELAADKTALIGRLHDLYGAALESLMDDTTNDPNAKRKVKL
jgi:hypothetical protein